MLSFRRRFRSYFPRCFGGSRQRLGPIVWRDHVEHEEIMELLIDWSRPLINDVQLCERFIDLDRELSGVQACSLIAASKKKKLGNAIAAYLRSIAPLNESHGNIRVNGIDISVTCDQTKVILRRLT